MRAARIPVFTLLVLAILALAHCAAMERRCGLWLDAVALADRAAAEERWEEAAEALDGLERDWDRCRPLLRLVVRHHEPDQARALLGRARLRCLLRQGPELRDALAELTVLLRQIRADEGLSLENIL
jgi:hypothetical protein